MSGRASTVVFLVVCLLLACSDRPPVAPVPADAPAAQPAAGSTQDPPAPPPPPATTRTPATDGDRGSDVTPVFTCQQNALPGDAPLRRLTMTQYRNTMTDLVGWALGDAAQAATVLAGAALDGLPEDRHEPTAKDPHGSYRRLDQDLEQVHVDSAFRSGTLVAAALVADGRLGPLVGACAVDALTDNDEACLSQFIGRFGARALRRPLDADDVMFYRGVYGADPTPSPDAYAALINVMLNAPEFLYFVEHGQVEDGQVEDGQVEDGQVEDGQVEDGQVEDGQVEDGSPGPGQDAVPAPSPGDPGLLTAHELAARLSYHFWQTMPDDELWATAEDGSLLDPDTYAGQVERLANDERARATMREFFADWLKVDAVPALDRNRSPAYVAFAGDDLPDGDLRTQMIDDVLDMASHYTWTDPAGLEALFTSDLVFARDEALAAIYGTSVWDGTSPPPSLPPGQRPGLLTRALFLANGSQNTRPIMKGVFIRRTLLCDDIPPPPPGVNAMQPEASATMTTRQATEQLTEQANTACAGCHKTLINPLGFATEGFDALGRERTEQVLYDDAGNELASLPVDTASVPQVMPGDTQVSTGPTDLVEMMLASGKLEACLARHYFRFTYGRWEDTTRDGCVLERLRRRLVETGRIDDLLEEIALTPEFRLRSFDTPDTPMGTAGEDS